jgi:signal transduction histidine kinase
MRDHLARSGSGLTANAQPGLPPGLARVFGHELGEIAALLDGYTSQLQDRAPADDVASLRRTTARLRNVFESLFELDEATSRPPSRSAFDPAAAVATARELLRDRAAAGDADLDVRIHPLPAVVADPAQVERLFTHVLRSAASTAPSGSPVIVAGSRKGSCVRLDVGVEPLVEHDLAGDDGRALVGQGIDLAVARQLAERSGGRLWVTGSDRSTRAVSLTFPAAEP